MSDVGTHTRVSPGKRQVSLKEFVESIKKSPEANQVLSNWGLQLDTHTVNLQVRTEHNFSIFVRGICSKKAFFSM